MSEYAPEYTRKERLRIVAVHSAWVIPGFFVVEYWFIPWLTDYADQAHCYDYGRFTGSELLLYSVFVGLPVVTGLLVLVIEGKRSLQILRIGQSPLPGEKVFRPTKYTYGLRAKVRPFMVICMVVSLLILSLMGVSSVREIPVPSDVTCTQ
jgi:hypothetical protein